VTDAALEIVFDHLYARRMSDVEALTRGLDPDVVHYGVLPELECTGRDAVVQRMRAALDPNDSGIEHLELNAAGERVVVGIAGPRFREVPFLDGELFILFTIRDGLIVRMDDFKTREAAFEAANLRAL
jgi:hypothetical protein